MSSTTLHAEPDFILKCTTVRWDSWRKTFHTGIAANSLTHTFTLRHSAASRDLSGGGYIEGGCCLLLSSVLVCRSVGSLKIELGCWRGCWTVVVIL